MLTLAKAQELGLVGLIAALDGGDEGASRESLAELVSAAKGRMQLTDRPDPAWFDGVADILLRSSGDTAPELRIDCLLLFAEWYLKEGKISAGAAVAAKAAEIARRANIYPQLRRAYSLLGIFSSRVKDIAQATVYYVKALEIAESISDRVAQCTVISNLAAARFDAGLLEESIVLSRYAVGMPVDGPRGDAIRRTAHHNIALVSFILADYDTALTHIELAQKYFPSESKTQLEAYQRVVFEFTFTKILVRSGQPDRARERVSLAMAFAEKSKSAPARLQARLAEALCDAAEHKTDIALTRVQRAKEEVGSNEAALRDVLEVEVLCNNFAGRHGDAKHYHQKYLAHLAEWQRKTAIQQVDTLRRSFKKRSSVTPDELTVLPDEVLERLRDTEDGSIRWESFQSRLETLAVLAELRDDNTGEHSFRVGRMAAMLARRIGYDEKRIATLELAARLHDIGKLAVPDVVLLKKAALTGAELEVMRRHTTEGAQILTDILAGMGKETIPPSRKEGSFRLAAEIAQHHHEWWNGEGYPRGVAGESIPEEARITALADVFDALTHERPYKAAWTVPQAMKEIEGLSGRQFDPRLCSEFLRLVVELHQTHDSDLDAFLGAEARSSPLVSANRVLGRIMRSALRSDTRGYPASPA